jgi:hypothetical protein
MKKENYLVITFKTTTMAMYMEKVCKEEKKIGRIIPLPKEIDAGCGMAWATKNKNQDEWNEYLIQKNIQYDKMVEVDI